MRSHAQSLCVKTGLLSKSTPKTSQSVKINPVWYGNSNVRRNTTPVPMSFIGIQTHKSEIPALTREFTPWDIEVYLTGNAISSLSWATSKGNTLHTSRFTRYETCPDVFYRDTRPVPMSFIGIRAGIKCRVSDIYFKYAWNQTQNLV